MTILTRLRLSALLVCLMPLATLAATPDLAQIRLPPGFRIEHFASVPNARQMALGKNTLFVGSMNEGKVYAIPLRNGHAGKPRVIAADLNLPVGVAYRNGDLYISAVSQILRIRNAERPGKAKLETVYDKLPTDIHHGWKFIAFGPDGQLYIPVGAPCNICNPDPDRYALIARHDLASGQREIVARGVRNSVGFDWHPQTGQLWFSENGRDMLGDDLPPDELNRVGQPGEHFGYPWCHAGTLPDPEFGTAGNCAESTPPAQALGAHVAAAGPALLHRQAVPGTLPQRRVRRRARLLEPQQQSRLPGHGRDTRRQPRRLLRTVRQRLAAEWRHRTGKRQRPPRRCTGDAGRQPAGIGRPRRGDLSDCLSGLRATGPPRSVD
jgi:glucose/arabinose dehydrogenase